ncbi:hypothetical protein BT96DRAFT_945332 [Gymnopus androsaceus JB14]|uniref:Uncharacterized protein n=1 Tax=Gymnopus androsaceus JB14 TaxID=1447944 RepID=A0A6A4H161_9AGAR|nr:hypothetical protein BT96DRAFT_945332 [Gymnopus androsaceus JB14]
MGVSSSSGGDFAAFAKVNPWSQNQASSSAAFASTSSRSQPAPIHLQRVEVDVPTRLNAPPHIPASTFGSSWIQTQSQSASSDPLTFFETRLKDFEASQQRKREEEEEQLRRQRQQQQQFAPPFASSFPTTSSIDSIPSSNLNTSQKPFPAQENVFNGPSALGSQASPWWNPGRVGLSTAQSYQSATFAPDMASIHGVFEMINLVVQVGPACYPAAHRLFSAASQAHAATSQVHAAAADIIAALPYAAPSQYQAQAQTQPLPSWQQSQQPSDSEPSSYQPLDAQSSFWNTAGRYCRYTSSLVQGISKSHRNRASFTRKHGQFKNRFEEVEQDLKAAGNKKDVNLRKSRLYPRRPFHGRGKSIVAHPRAWVTLAEGEHLEGSLLTSLERQFSRATKAISMFTKDFEEECEGRETIVTEEIHIGSIIFVTNSDYKKAIKARKDQYEAADVVWIGEVLGIKERSESSSEDKLVQLNWYVGAKEVQRYLELLAIHPSKPSKALRIISAVVSSDTVLGLAKVQKFQNNLQDTWIPTLGWFTRSQLTYDNDNNPTDVALLYDWYLPTSGCYYHPEKDQQLYCNACDAWHHVECLQEDQNTIDCQTNGIDNTDIRKTVWALDGLKLTSR